MTNARGLRYSNVAIALHWAIVALILFNLATGLLFDDMGKAMRSALIAPHISSGITVLALTAIRIGWRLTHRPPPYLPMAAWEKALAKTVHVLLYLAMLGMPLSGWAMISAHADSPPVAKGTAAPTPVDQPPGARPAPPPHKPTMIWGVIPLPKIAPIVRIGDGRDGEAKLHEAHEFFESKHAIGGWVLLALLVLHVAGALKHQMVDRERELARMGLGRA
ncbi:MAG: cytochrome b [Sphingomonadaceae bacterium]|nr:cytochrome b [Sphingomonadaceae bacterium]